MPFDLGVAVALLWHDLVAVFRRAGRSSQFDGEGCERTHAKAGPPGECFCADFKVWVAVEQGFERNSGFQSRQHEAEAKMRSAGKAQVGVGFARRIEHVWIVVFGGVPVGAANVGGDLIAPFQGLAVEGCILCDETGFGHLDGCQVAQHFFDKQGQVGRIGDDLLFEAWVLGEDDNCAVNQVDCGFVAADKK